MQTLEISNVLAAEDRGHDLAEEDVAWAAEPHETDAEECGCLRFR